jgi:hypothetical protein
MSLQECDCQSLRKRVDALESQNRRYMKVGIVVLIAAACAVFMAQARPGKPVKILEADSFVLRDELGHVRATLGMGQGEQPSLVLLDSAGSPSVMIGGGNQPEVTIFDSATKTKRVSMWLSTTGPSFGLFDRVGTRASLYLRDSLDEQRLTFVDEKAIPRVGIGLVKSEPSEIMADASGNTIWYAPPASAIGAGTAPSVTRPRVVIESWESEEASGIFAARPPRQNAQALDEMPVFIQRCPQAAAAVEKHEGDYVLRFDHHYGQGSYSYGYTLFDPNGGSLGAGSNLALWTAVDTACKGMLTDWASRTR